MLPTPPASRRRHHAIRRACALAGPLTVAICLTACQRPAGQHDKQESTARDRPATEWRAELAATRLDLAQAANRRGLPDEALALAVAALELEPSAKPARTLVSELLATGRWQWPVTTLAHGMQVDHLAFAAPAGLWVGLSGQANTAVRWNLETLEIQSVLFPTDSPPTRTFVTSPTHQTLVLERNGVTLLCNAQSLRPTCDLGRLPPELTPSAVIAFSADGLLVAHPAADADQSVGTLWHIRDAGTGEIIRSSEPGEAGEGSPLAAFIDRNALRVLRADGSVFTLPVSPVEPSAVVPAAEPCHLLHAQYATNGASALALQTTGPHSRPQPTVLKWTDAVDGSLEPAALAQRFPWNRQPGIWTGLLEEPPLAPLQVDDRTLNVPASHQPPLHATSNITAVAVDGTRTLIGEANGTVTIYQTLPAPQSTSAATEPIADPDAACLTALRFLTEAMTGCHYDESLRQVVRREPAQRSEALHRCDFTALRRGWPALDFSPLTAVLAGLNYRTAPPAAMLPVWDRLARADGTGASWPKLLESALPLANTPWHQQLTAAVVARSSNTPAADADATSPWLAPQRIEQIFAQGDEAAIKAAIAEAGSHGPAAAKALQLALASNHPEWIEVALAQAKPLPPLLAKLAAARIAWLEGRKADALSGWPEVWPDLHEIRLREDWDGWEQADFAPALTELRECLGQLLTAIDVPANPTAEQRQTLAKNLADPATLAAVGRNRFAKACLKAALAFAVFKEETATTLTLASRARELGEDPAPCLRAEAMALTAMGDYQKAHARWISLITDYPVASHQPGDYAEASYTAFENADPRQAMAILTTGLHRFPNDGNFAMRAGWVALLTGNAERAYRFLLTGQQIGFPPEKLENALALLAIAAQQTGANEDAAAFYQDLVSLDAAWQNPDTLESLQWPEELKQSLRELVPLTGEPDKSGKVHH